jgi:hypothetical protein
MLTYIFFTFAHLNGGFYLDGLYLNIYCSIFVQLCILVSLFISNKFDEKKNKNTEMTNIEYSIINDDDDDDDDGFENDSMSESSIKNNEFLIEKRKRIQNKNILVTYQNQKNNDV